VGNKGGLTPEDAEAWGLKGYGQAASCSKKGSLAALSHLAYK